MNRLWLTAALASVIACSSSGNSAGNAGDASVANDGDASGECAIPCGGNCCNLGSVCIADAAGNKSCAVSCTNSSQCAASTPCCAMFGDAGPLLVAGVPAPGMCAPNQVGVTSCLCEKGADCAPFDLPDEQTSCAPYAVDDVSSDYYVCKNQGGSTLSSQAWDGCSDESTCPTGYSCWTDRSGNAFCTHACVTSATCGNPGNACCYGPDAGASCIENDGRGCGDGPGGCMPCGAP